jgi:hypothetical protein
MGGRIILRWIRRKSDADWIPVMDGIQQMALVKRRRAISSLPEQLLASQEFFFFVEFITSILKSFSS